MTDIPAVLRNTHRVLCFDTERIFLRGVTNPAYDFIKNSVFSKDCTLSYRLEDAENIEFSQIQIGGNSANFLYGIFPNLAFYCDLVEALCKDIGKMGKYHLLANVPADSDEFSFLKANGFHTYSVQSIRKTLPFNQAGTASHQWAYAQEEDLRSVISFYTRCISPFEASIQSWNFSDTFHLILRATSNEIAGVARVRYFANRAVILPLIDSKLVEFHQSLIALMVEMADIFSTIYIREPANFPLDKTFLENHTEACVQEDHYMLRNLVIFNPLKNYQPADLFEERSIPKPTTPYSRP